MNASSHFGLPAPARSPNALARTHHFSALRAVAVALVLSLAAVPASAAGFRFVTDNDFLADSGDDLYSFGVALEIHNGPYTVTLAENGFTDRAAGVRFDETYFTVGRALSMRGGWQAWGELGVAHVGNGILGESFQNEFHRLIDADAVHLRYAEEGRLSPVASFAAARLVPLRHGLAVGPYVEASVTPGLKAHALAAAQATWDLRGPLSLEALLGARASDAEFAPLEPRMGGTSAQAELAIVYRDRLALSWSYNASGTRQEHLAIGYRVGTVSGLAHALTR